MNNITRLLALVLAALMLVTCFVACGDETPDDTKPSGGTNKPVEETGRHAIADGVPADLNFASTKENTITFFVRDNDQLFEYEVASENLMNNALFDAIHYRNIDIENRLGVKIKSVGQDGSYAASGTWNETFSTSVLTNQYEYDGAFIYAAMSSPLVTQGIYLNLMDVCTTSNGYIDLDKPWWNQTALDELSYAGSLYFLGGDIAISQVSKGLCLFFNKDLFAEKFPDEQVAGLYQLVRDGKWTIDKMTDYVNEVWDDTNNNGMIDMGDTCGYLGSGDRGDGTMDAWIYAMGLRITTKDHYGEPQYSAMYDPELTPKWEAVKRLVVDSRGVVHHNYVSSGTTMPEATSIGAGNLLFFMNYLDYGETLRASSANFGVLPLPMYNEDQDGYSTCFWDGSSLLVLARNLKLERYGMVSATLELMAAESYKQVTPTYFSKVLQGLYSKDQPDAEMFDIITGSYTMDFGLVYSSKSLAMPGVLFRRMFDPKWDLANEIAKNGETWENKLGELLDALLALDA